MNQKDETDNCSDKSECNLDECNPDEFLDLENLAAEVAAEVVAEVAAEVDAEMESAMTSVDTDPITNTDSTPGATDETTTTVVVYGEEVKRMKFSTNNAVPLPTVLPPTVQTISWLFPKHVPSDPPNWMPVPSYRPKLPDPPPNADAEVLRKIEDIKNILGC
tara:strand:+ start:90 stop:575 length:486 start_codon:yes stop_codon:yes gene_type:complete